MSCCQVLDTHLSSVRDLERVEMEQLEFVMGQENDFKNLSSSVIFHIANNELYVALCVFLICFA